MCGWLSKKYKRFDLLSYIGCSKRRKFQLIWHRLYGYGYISNFVTRECMHQHVFYWYVKFQFIWWKYIFVKRIRKQHVLSPRSRWSSKLDVKKTPAQSIEMSLLWIILILLCLSSYNLKCHCTTHHLICSHWFENHKSILQTLSFWNCMF